ncbi:MAG TPA: hypothetical protein VKB60_04090, partial [Terriglobales bacterium]|nr:hypothetical protein [Terriglobales bacterium]
MTPLVMGTLPEMCAQRPGLLFIARWLLPLLCLALGSSLSAGARNRGQASPAGPRIAMAARVARAPRLDGTLHDPV